MADLFRFWRLVSADLSWLTALDILLVAIALYYLILLVKGTRAFQLLKGLVFYAIFILLADRLGLHAFRWILGLMLLPGVIVLIVLFAPELRYALEQMGRGRLVPVLSSMKREEISQFVNELVSAVASLSRERIGALVVIEGRVGLNDIIATGREIGGRVTAELLRTIFYPGTPLHDLAVVIRGDRLMAAGCLLPLSSRDNTNFNLGTRHRAALGLSETSDALIVVVSEETGAISLAREGKLHQNLSTDALKARLLNLLVPSERSHFSPWQVPVIKGIWRKLPHPKSEKSDAPSKS
jgi:diadenylate cyclase